MRIARCSIAIALGLGLWLVTAEEAAAQRGGSGWRGSAPQLPAPGQYGRSPGSLGRLGGGPGGMNLWQQPRQQPAPWQQGFSQGRVGFSSPWQPRSYASMPSYRNPRYNYQTAPAPAAVPNSYAKIINPSDSAGSISYTVNGQRFTINPGEVQELRRSPSWLVSFDRGPGSGLARYRLTSGTYTFRPNDQGWELYHQDAI